MKYLGPFSKMSLSHGARAFSRKVAFVNYNIQEFGVWFDRYYNSWKIVFSVEHYNTLECAKEALDNILIKQSWTFLTEEQIEKLGVLM